MRRAATSMLRQISSASGTNNSPAAVRTCRSGVPAAVPSPGKKTSCTVPTTRGEFCFHDWVFKDRAANQVADEILAGGKFHAVRKGDQHLQPAQLLGIVNGGASDKMKNPMFRVIAVHPEILQADRSRFVLGLAEENLQAGRKSSGKIGEQFGQYFTFIAARTNDARDLHPALLFSGRFQSSSISSVKRLRSFIPAAPRSVRMALAVRPWRPITLPKSSG